MKRTKSRQQKRIKKPAFRRRASTPAATVGHKMRFEQLLDDAILGVKKK